MTDPNSTRLSAPALALLTALASSACIIGHAPPPPALPPAPAATAPTATSTQSPRGPRWQSLHSAAGDRFRFARNLTGLEHQGEMYLSFYEHISGRSQVFVKKWNGNGWSDVPLPAIVVERPTGRQKLRSHDGALYLSFFVGGTANEHVWHIYRQDNDGRWLPVGEPVVYRNFKWGILADDFAFSPTGRMYRAWSGDRAVALEVLDGNDWRPVVGMPHSAGFLDIEFDSAGQLLLAVGDPEGRPGLTVKALVGGELVDMSRGLDYPGYSERYHFVRDGDDLYLAFRVSVPSRGFRVYRYRGDTWTPVGRQPIAFSATGDSGDSFGFLVHRGKPMLSYRESGMNFIPMVLEYTDANGWTPVGRPGFFNHNVMTPRLFAFADRLLLFFTWQDRSTSKTLLETFQYRE